MKHLQVFLNDSDRIARTFDEVRMVRAAAERLDANGSTSGAEISKPRPNDEWFKYSKQRFAYPIGHWSSTDDRHRNTTTTMLSCDDSQRSAVWFHTGALSASAAPVARPIGQPRA
jgi:hypothetical protein